MDIYVCTRVPWANILTSYSRCNRLELEGVRARADMFLVIFGRVLFCGKRDPYLNVAVKISMIKKSKGKNVGLAKLGRDEKNERKKEHL